MLIIFPTAPCSCRSGSGDDSYSSRRGSRSALPSKRSYSSERSTGTPPVSKKRIIIHLKPINVLTQHDYSTAFNVLTVYSKVRSVTNVALSFLDLFLFTVCSFFSIYFFYFCLVCLSFSSILYLLLSFSSVLKIFFFSFVYSFSSLILFALICFLLFSFKFPFLSLILSHLSSFFPSSIF